MEDCYSLCLTQLVFIHVNDISLYLKKIGYAFLSICLLIDVIFTIEYRILRELFIISRILIN